MIALPASRRADHHHHSLALHAEMEIIFFEASRTVVPHGQRRGATYLLVIDPGPCLPFVSPSIACLIACPPRRTGGSLSGRPHFVTAPTSNGPSPPRPHAPATVRYVCRGFELDVRVARRRGGSNVAHRKGWRASWLSLPCGRTGQRSAWRRKTSSFVNSSDPSEIHGVAGSYNNTGYEHDGVLVLDRNLSPPRRARHTQPLVAITNGSSDPPTPNKGALN
jgi:hypothetical protein